MSHDWAVENKGGHPQPWLPAPFALCLAHAPPTCTICFPASNTNALVEEAGCKMYARSRAGTQMRVCDKLTDVGGRAQIYSINGGSIAPNLPSLAPGATDRTSVVCGITLRHKCIAMERCQVVILPLLPHQRCAPLNRLDDYFLYIRDSYPQTEL